MEVVELGQSPPSLQTMESSWLPFDGMTRIGPLLETPFSLHGLGLESVERRKESGNTIMLGMGRCFRGQTQKKEDGLPSFHCLQDMLDLYLVIII